MKTKICSKCKKIKKITEFCKDKRTSDSLYSACRKCHTLLYKEYQKKYIKKWYKNNKEYSLSQNSLWRKNNLEKFRETRRKKSREIRKTLRGNLDHRIGRMIWKGLKKNKNWNKWQDIVGYTLEDLKKHLENQFDDKMNWKKFLNGEIHIDHIIPKSWFIYKKQEDIGFKMCWDLNNLQPLWAKDNLIKSNKFVS